MKILVTGGAGFIGSHLIEGYQAAGHVIVVVDDLSCGLRQNVPAGVTFYEADIADIAPIVARERPEVINHHAANMSVKVSVDDPQLDARINVQGLLAVLLAATQHGVRKVVYASSGGTVYGMPQTLPIAESHPMMPLSPYGITKMAGEHYLRFFATERGLASTILRYGNVYGPRQLPHGEAGVVSIFAQKMLANEAPRIDWDGEQRKDYVYVKDVVDLNMRVLTAGDGEIYNVGSGTATTVNDLYRHLAELIQYTGKPVYGERRPGDLREFYLDCAKATAELGWPTPTPLATGLAETCGWFARQAKQA
ncbi:MAG: NAD-dependent epimerase/dehydratase family protein [Candidatus Sericytochromatia bacterium]|nr:NAD-dependent epimerase/dehydratase family protein [Candidatus Sericytochromatia bacterium]